MVAAEHASLSLSVADKLLGRWRTRRVAVDRLNSVEHRAWGVVHADKASVAVRNRYVARPLLTNQKALFVAGLIPGRRAKNVS